MTRVREQAEAIPTDPRFAAVRAPGRTPEARRFAGYAWSVLAANLLVILWGAVVRATGSGAGCGEHWPLCQGVVIPHAAQIATMIEFAHRATSGVIVVLVIVLAWLGFRRFARRHAVRWYASAAVFFTFTEGLIGAALVLFGQVGNNASLTRALILSLHLVNTFLLLASLALCARSASADGPALPDRPAMDKGSSGRSFEWYIWYGAGCLAALVVAVTGTVAALGDTLFRTTSLAESLHSDFSATSNILLRLRVIHPAVALAAGVFLALIAIRALTSATASRAKLLAKGLLTLIFVQFALGLLNLLLLTPLWTQLLHLLTADLMWLTLVLLSAETFSTNGAWAAGRRLDTSMSGHLVPVPDPPRPANKASRGS